MAGKKAEPKKNGAEQTEHSGSREPRKRQHNSRLSVENVQMALEQAGGLRTATAKLLGVGRTTLYNFLNKHPELWDTVQDQEEALLDLAEGQVRKWIREGDKKTVMWYLDRKGKPRGFGNVNIALSGQKDGEPIKTTATIDTSKMSPEALQELALAMAAGAEEGDDK